MPPHILRGPFRLTPAEPTGPTAWDAYDPVLDIMSAGRSPGHAYEMVCEALDMRVRDDIARGIGLPPYREGPLVVRIANDPGGSLWVSVQRSEEFPGTWIAHCLSLNVFAPGETPREAVDDVVQLALETIADDREHGFDSVDRRSPADHWLGIALE